MEITMERTSLRGGSEIAISPDVSRQTLAELNETAPRAVVRCQGCWLVQFRPRTERCRRCQKRAESGTAGRKRSWRNEPGFPAPTFRASRTTVSSLDISARTEVPVGTQVPCQDGPRPFTYRVWMTMLPPPIGWSAPNAENSRKFTLLVPFSTVSQGFSTVDSDQIFGSTDILLGNQHLALIPCRLSHVAGTQAVWSRIRRGAQE